MATFDPKDGNNVDRHLARFQQNRWGKCFADYMPDDEATKIEKEQQIEKLVKDAKKDLLMVAQKPAEQLNFINAVQRLDLSYHFEIEIEDALRNIFNTCNDFESDDLYHTSLGFRLLRQHGFYVSSGIFQKFEDGKGNFQESLKKDVEGMLSLYEAAHLRTHGDDILDRAVVFATNHLKSVSGVTHELNYYLLEDVTNALKSPLHRSLPRLQARHYIPIYEHYPTRNQTLLKLAKLDYNYLQCCHKEELKDIVSWWNEHDLPRKLGYIKDRIVEASLWGFAIYHGPHFVLGRKISAKIVQLLTTLDDTYDAYGTVEELEIFTEALHRWDKEYIKGLKFPDTMKAYYVVLYDAFEEFEQELADEGRSDCVNYVREELKILSRYYLQETKWCYEKYTPNYDEYMKIALPASGYTCAIGAAFLGMGHTATPETFAWLSRNPPPVVGSCAILRLLNDIAGRKFDNERDHVASAVDCYMKQYSMCEKDAVGDILKQVEDYWKDLNHVFLRPSEVPLPLANCVLNYARCAEFFYRSGDDAYTSLGNSMGDRVRDFFIDPIPI